MKLPFSFVNWPLRARMAMLLVAASLLPLAVAAWIDLQQAREQLVADTAGDLAARSEQLVRELDALNLGYRRSAQVLAHSSQVLASVQGQSGNGQTEALQGLMTAFASSDKHLRGVALLDTAGVVQAASEKAMLGVDLSYRRYVRAGLAGKFVISDPFVAEPQAGEESSIAYAAPVLAPDGKPRGLAVLWVRASMLASVFKANNNLLGEGSVAVMMDRHGIRIASSGVRQLAISVPAGPLTPQEVEALVAERRFGAKTREAMAAIQPTPELFAQARAEVPDKGMFRANSAVLKTPLEVVARRLQTVDWTAYYVVTEQAIDERVARMTRNRVLIALACMLLALAVGVWAASVVLRPVDSLAQATAAIAGGRLSARARISGSDELGRLGMSFNTMAERIETQDTALRGARDELELRVQERTVQLQRTADALEAENAERQRTQGKLQSQLARMKLLDEITCAIGERQDLRSIYQVVIRSLEEQLPLDFCCACQYDAVANTLTVTSVGVGSEALAMELAMSQQARVGIDENGLSQCVRGKLIYEPDLAGLAFAFPQRLLRGGLHSLVMAPLLAESQVFGVLVAARRTAESFSSGECEFLRQVSEHVGLAAQQAQLYGALQQAYDDLRQTQQAVMQQERLRALGQMASGIAHDINNAISPVGLYAQSLLEREPNLSPRAREYLENIERAIADVASTVGRLREFYRQREPQMQLTAVRLDQLVQQVIELTRARWSDMPQQRGQVIELVLDLAPDLPRARGVESEIRDALTNLVFNAVDAMPEGGTLTLRTRVLASQSSPQVCVDVSDTGAGMDEETRRRCLEPFFTTKGERGTGLGLGMVYGVMQRHGGELDIDSSLGAGTTMTLRFPVAETGADVAALAHEQPPGITQRRRILLVDDDPLMLKSLRDTLESEGHEVFAANGGQAGIDAFRAAQARGEIFEAVITDLGMPHVDGRKVAQAVKQASAATPVILLTGWGRRMVAEGDIPDHVDEVLSKPPKLRELRLALARLVADAQEEEVS
ncbi:MAG TPA: ATP-binding protein [Burkholderiaceae bacterium]|nr:ATP-binding protein [Burkholderiaceae bacterium]